MFNRGIDRIRQGPAWREPGRALLFRGHLEHFPACILGQGLARKGFQAVPVQAPDCPLSPRADNAAEDDPIKQAVAGQHFTGIVDAALLVFCQQNQVVVLDRRLEAVREPDPVGVLSINRRFDDYADSPSRVRNAAIIPLHRLGGDDLGSRGIDQVQAVVDTMAHAKWGVGREKPSPRKERGLLNKHDGGWG